MCFLLWELPPDELILNHLQAGIPPKYSFPKFSLSASNQQKKKSVKKGDGVMLIIGNAIGILSNQKAGKS